MAHIEMCLPCASPLHFCSQGELIKAQSNHFPWKNISWGKELTILAKGSSEFWTFLVRFVYSLLFLVSKGWLSQDASNFCIATWTGSNKSLISCPVSSTTLWIVDFGTYEFPWRLDINLEKKICQDYLFHMMYINPLYFKINKGCLNKQYTEKMSCT